MTPDSLRSPEALLREISRDMRPVRPAPLPSRMALRMALVAVLATAKVFEGFEAKPVERPAHRWVVVADDELVEAESAAALELPGEEPAA